ncbi:MAG: 4-hydroxy-tetrahydrodipicolinate reductase [Bacteroidetes bacterium]|nr:MAG: 4-hydroxy-tetrahydrodipicolinate reductase [Bacteroidota bacterium]MBL1144657.1 4-hydroxy-tetrahydrodipicolinate reductase [Bacteroidota bacterium]NOG57452.1 4-hydroxy-tetrahydrodipicolinate reductase [Bacteroidota bacterium]
MKIALFGYGKMGKAIEEIALDRGHEIVKKLTSQNDVPLKKEDLNQADVVIEFTRPEKAANHILTCFDFQIPIIVGTTGWYNDIDMVKSACKEKQGSLLAATNFSIGVNLFFELNKQLARLMDKKAYQVEIEEIHHLEKLDSPSGTAITLAEGIIENNKAYQNWKNHITTLNGEIPIHSLREAGVSGTHEVKYHSDIDEISIQHKAKNRKGFALGAVIAAEFIQDKKGIFTMQDILKS